MIEYFKNLFTKPQYQWTLLDDLAIIGLVVGVALIIFGILFVVLMVREKVKRNRQIKKGGRDES